MLRVLSVIFFTNFIHTSPLLLDNARLLLNFSSPSLPPLITSLTNTSVFLGNQLKQCFQPGLGRLPTTYEDCEMAAYRMNSDSTGETMTFSRQPTAQMRLPRSWRAGTCVVYLDMLHDTDEDTLQTMEVLMEMLALNTECIGRQNLEALRLGGLVSVGPKQLLHVVIFGREDPNGRKVS